MQPFLIGGTFNSTDVCRALLFG